MTTLPAIGALRRAATAVYGLYGLALAAPPARAQPTPRLTAARGEIRLADVLAASAAHHPLVDAARARVAAARGARRTAGTLGNPVLTYWTEGARFPGQQSSALFERETQVYATLPLEPVLQRSSRVRRADEDVRAAAADLARARQTVTLDAAGAFYRVAAAQVAVDAAEDVRARLAELVTYTQARVREGKTAEADLIRTQVELERVETDVTFQRVEFARAYALLVPYLGDAAPRVADSATAAGVDTTSPRIVVDEGAGAETVTALPPLAVLLTAARAARPDVLAARARAAAARAEIGVQQSLLVRQLGATFGGKRTTTTTSMIASLSLPLPLIDQNRGEVERATALRTAADDELAWAERQADAEVRAAYDATVLLGKQSARLRGGFLARAEEARRIALAAYREGAVSLLQVLDASRTLGDARQLYYRTLFAQRQSLLELRAAAGDDPAGGAPPPSSTPRPARVSGARP